MASTRSSWNHPHHPHWTTSTSFYIIIIRHCILSVAIIIVLLATPPWLWCIDAAPYGNQTVELSNNNTIVAKNSRGIDENGSIPRICLNDLNCKLTSDVSDRFVCRDGICQELSRDSGRDLNSSSSSPKGNKTGNRSSGTPSHMMLILIIMGIMFLGMCVALNLFSRARFKNRRSVFSNPRVLKVGSSYGHSDRRRFRRKSSSTSQHHHHRMKRQTSLNVQKNDNGGHYTGGVDLEVLVPPNNTTTLPPGTLVDPVANQKDSNEETE